MGADSKIQWTHHTFNPWIGCSKVSAGCANCYAEALDRRWGHHRWGPGAPREVTSPSYWREPLRWNAAAKAAGERHRVFCASLADVFDVEAPEGAFSWLLALVEATPDLDWLFVTKRPERAAAVLGRHAFPFNVWLGTSVEDQRAADERIPHLLRSPATLVRFLSIEPLLGPVDLRKVNAGDELGHPLFSLELGAGIDWVIVGGESGAKARPMELAWARWLVEQCQDAAVPVFVKQLGADPVGLTIGGKPARLLDHKGGDILEWPGDLRRREFPLGGLLP